MLQQLRHDWRQARTRRIRDAIHAYASEALGRQYLDSNVNKRLASCTTPTLTDMLFTANHGFINLHLTAKPVAVRANYRCPKAVQHRSGCLAGSEAQQTLEQLCRDTVFHRSHVPSNGEPNCERRTSAMEDCPHGHRYTTSAMFTPEPPITHAPAPSGPAARAHKTVRPAQPLKIVETGVIIGKPCAQLSHLNLACILLFEFITV